MSCSDIHPLINSVEQFVRDDLKVVDCSHDWNHINRVRSNAMKILKDEQLAGRFLEADSFVIEIAALMHDVGDFKYTKDHSAGSRMVKEFLFSHLDNGISQEQIEKVCLIVGNISFRHELSHGLASDLPVELKIVQDADRLDAIGAIGVARCFAFTGAKNRSFYDEESVTDNDFTAEKYNKQEEINGGTAVGHFYEKLFKLKTLMKTESGRQRGEERHNFMVNFIRTIEEECNLPKHTIPNY